MKLIFHKDILKLTDLYMSLIRCLVLIKMELVDQHHSCPNLMNVMLSWNNLVLLMYLVQILFFVQFLKVVDFKNRQKIRLFKSTYLHWKHYTSVIGKMIFIYDFFSLFSRWIGSSRHATWEQRQQVFIQSFESICDC